MKTPPAENLVQPIPGAQVLPPPAPERAEPERETPAEESPLQPLPAGTGWLPRDSGAWLVSAAAHALAVYLLSWAVWAAPGFGPPGLVFGAVDPVEDELVDLDLGATLSGAREIAPSVSPVTTNALEAMASPGVTNIEPPIEMATSPGLSVEPVAGGISGFESDLLLPASGGFEGRGFENRRGLALSGGGSAASEAAVEAGLAWLAAHQYPDGSWRFDLENCPGCQGSCRNSGFARTDSASTGLALLCFLGAGYTHQDGPYQDAVTNGLYFLTQQMVITPHGGDLRGRRGSTGPSAGAVEINRDRNFIEKDGLVMVNQGGVGVITRAGDMYSQGIATLALCEAYGMTGDGELKGAAEEAVEFIINAQYPSGGWRYDPKWELIPDGSEYEKNVFLQADTTITGWQVTALKSALLAGIRIPRPLWYRVGDYLDTVQGDGGSTYGYKAPEKDAKKNRTTTTIGLFCRMMLGWPKDYRPLQKGLGRIAGDSPRGNHMYMNYYASQILHHAGGRGWERWNRQMRDYLVDTQNREGHERGSWYFQEEWSGYGGRLYTTSMAILTLEVYYRYLPMYGEAFVDGAP